MIELYLKLFFQYAEAPQVQFMWARASRNGDANAVTSRFSSFAGCRLKNRLLSSSEFLENQESI